MDTPPKISEFEPTPVKRVAVEVLSPDPDDISESASHPGTSSRESGATAGAAHAASDGAPIHALSAILLVAVDNLWNLEEWMVVTWIFTIPLSFLSVFVPVYLIQKHLKKDSTGRALAFAALLGVIAAIPTSLTGTPVGVGLLAWTGFKKWLKMKN